MESLVVTGKFVNKDTNEPIDGYIEFIPSKLWIEDEYGVTYATLAPRMNLRNGMFKVELTKTDQGEYPWYYTVRCPKGTWSVKITGDEPLGLKDLLPKFA